MSTITTLFRARVYFYVSTLFALLFLLPSLSTAQQVIELKQADEEYFIGKGIRIYQDYYRKLTIHDILSDSIQAKFFINEKTIGNEGNSGAKVWASFDIESQADVDWYLELSNPLLHDIEFYEIAEDSTMIRKYASSHLNFSKREVDMHLYYFSLALKKGEKKRIYLSHVATYPLEFPLSIASLKTFMEKNHKLDVFHGTFFGIMLIMILYNLFVFFSTKDQLYLYYVLYVVFMGLMIMHFLGYAFNFLWPFFAFLNEWPAVLPCLGLTSALVFSVKFLNLKKTSPWVYKVSIAMIITVYLSFVLNIIHYFALFDSPLPIVIAALIIQIIALLLDILLFGTALVLYLQGYKQAKYYLIAWSFLMIGAFFYILFNLGFLPGHFLIKYALELGISFEVCFLSFALADRINVYKQERANAQKAYIAQLEENDRIVKNQKADLERQVEERTIELVQKNESLEHANEEIQRQRDEVMYARDNLQSALDNLKAAQEQLIQQEKLASLGQLTAGIAHEIKNPLNFVNNFSSVSIELVEEVQEEVERAIALEDREIIEEILGDISANLKKIHEHGSRADRIVKSMLQHSRSGNEEKSMTDLNAMIKEFSNLSFHGMRASAKKMDCDLVFELDDSIKEIPLIAQDFSRVVLNLTANAFDAMWEKKSTTHTAGYLPKLHVKTEKIDNMVRINITDNGPGIPDNIKDKILQPFFTTKKGTEGTGLGLSITSDIIKAHSGKLEILNLEEGVSFQIQLPV